LLSHEICISPSLYENYSLLLSLSSIYVLSLVSRPTLSGHTHTRNAVSA
jgi:hypothetical protein